MCEHQFIEIQKLVKKASPEPSSVTAPIANRWHDTAGVQAGCILCGEVRSVWEDGTVKIEPSHAQTS